MKEGQKFLQKLLDNLGKKSGSPLTKVKVRTSIISFPVVEGFVNIEDPFDKNGLIVVFENNYGTVISMKLAPTCLQAIQPMIEDNKCVLRLMEYPLDHKIAIAKVIAAGIPVSLLYVIQNILDAPLPISVLLPNADQNLIKTLQKQLEELGAKVEILNDSINAV